MREYPKAFVRTDGAWRCLVCGMPVVDGGHNCPSLMAMPSRDFLIRQAVMNWEARTYPNLPRGWPLSRISLGGTRLEGTPEVVDAIRAEFRVLVAKHGGTTCPSR